MRLVVTDPIRIEGEDATVHGCALGGKLARTVLVLLALETGRPVPGETFVDALWQGRPPATWRSALRSQVSKVRAFFAEAGIDGPDTVTSAFGCYQLNLPEEVEVDVLLASAGVERAEDLLVTGAVDAAAELASKAAEIARCPLLPGTVADPIDSARDELDLVLARAVRIAAEAHMVTGAHGEAIRAAEEALTLEPYRETTYELLMRAHAAAGDQAEALRVFERCRRLLAEELGVDPSAALITRHVELLSGGHSTPDDRNVPARATDEPARTDGWPLVGRDRELLAAAQALDAGTHHGGVALVGRPGDGRTRLLTEVLDRAAAAGSVTHHVRAIRATAAVPLAPLAPLLPDDDPTASLPERIQRARRALTATGGPVVVGVDDAHHLDDGSATLLATLALDGSTRVVVALDAELDAPTQVAELVRGDVLVRVPVAPLPRRAVEHLLRAVLGEHIDGQTLHDLWDASRGNVRLLREIVRDSLAAASLEERNGLWWWRWPHESSRLRRTVEARTADLTPQQREALEVVAFLESADPLLVEQAVTPAALESLEAAGMVQLVPDGRRHYVELVSPAHAHVLRRSLPPLRARNLQRRLLGDLRSLPGRRHEDVLRIATWQLATDTETDANLLLDAASAAAAGLDHPHAEALARAAMERGGGVPAHLALATALAEQGRAEEAEALLADGEPAGATTAQEVDLALLRATNLLWRLGRPDDAASVLETALEHAREPRERSRLLASLAMVACVAGRLDEALSAAEDMLCHPVDDRRAVVTAIAYAAPALAQIGRIQDALGIIDQGLPVVATVKGRGPASIDQQLRRAHINVLRLGGRLTEAIRVATGAYDDAIRRREPGDRGLAAFHLARLEVVAGRADAADRWVVEAAEVLREANFDAHRPWILAVQAHIAALRGDTRTAEARLEEASAAGPDLLAVVKAEMALAAAAAAAADGRCAESREMMQLLAELAAGAGQHAVAAIGWHEAARYGDRGDAPRQLRELATRTDSRLLPVFATHAGALEEGDAAGLAAASEEFEELGLLLNAAEAAVAAACALHTRGEPAHAAAAARRAGRLADQCAGTRVRGLDDATAVSGTA